MAELECVVAGADRLGESPIWNVAEQALYWVDSRAPAVRRFDPASGAVRDFPLPAVVGSIGFRKSGGLLVAMQSGFHAFDPESGALQAIADPEKDIPDNRFNDGRADRAGRFWSGTMSDVKREPTGSLYRLDPDHSITKIRDDIVVPNSIAWSPDDRTMYFADTYRTRILAYDFSLAEGAISNPRLFFDLTAGPGRPDGSAVDADGCLWNAAYAGSRVVRYTPRGEIDRVIELPVSQPTCCCFGGPDLGTLYITTATQRLTPEQLAKEPLAGGVFAIRPGVKGLPESFYAG